MYNVFYFFRAALLTCPRFATTPGRIPYITLHWLCRGGRRLCSASAGLATGMDGLYELSRVGALKLCSLCAVQCVHIVVVVVVLWDDDGVLKRTEYNRLCVYNTRPATSTREQAG